MSRIWQSCIFSFSSSFTFCLSDIDYLLLLVSCSSSSVLYILSVCVVIFILSFFLFSPSFDFLSKFLATFSFQANFEESQKLSRSCSTGCCIICNNWSLSFKDNLEPGTRLKPNKKGPKNSPTLRTKVLETCFYYQETANWFYSCKVSWLWLNRVTQKSCD